MPVVLFAATVALAQPAKDLRRSGYDDMRPATQAIQRDDAQNPAMLWVAEGAALFQRPALAQSKACIACHSMASMRGVAARYPAFDTLLARPVSLSHRINLCRQRHQNQDALAPESQPLLALETWVAYQSRGEPIASLTDARLVPHRDSGEKLFNRRIGQLGLSCAQCHDQSAGQRLGGSTIAQGHPTGYPIYRLEWQSVGSLPRRLRGCMTGVRAEPLEAHSLEMTELELYLAARAMGMRLETPGVRP